MYVGSRLSYPKERIIQGSAERLARKEMQWEGLSVVYIELPATRLPEAPTGRMRILFGERCP